MVAIRKSDNIQITWTATDKYRDLQYSLDRVISFTTYSDFKSSIRKKAFNPQTDLFHEHFITFNKKKKFLPDDTISIPAAQMYHTVTIPLWHILYIGVVHWQVYCYNILI